MTFPGWTWEYIDENMTLERWNIMAKHWRQHPPLHTLAAGMAGYRPPPELAPPEPEPPEFEE